MADAINNVATQATYVDALTLGPTNYDYVSYFVYNNTCVAQAFDLGPGGDFQTGSYGPEQLIAPSSGLIQKTGGVRFRTNPATPSLTAQIIAYGFKSGNSQWIGGQPLTQTIAPSGIITNGGAMLTGIIPATGTTPTAGTGFTYTHVNGSGTWVVTFTGSTFSAAPVVLAIALAQNTIIATVDQVTASGFRLELTTAAGAFTDQPWNFAAIPVV